MLLYDINFIICKVWDCAQNRIVAINFISCGAGLKALILQIAGQFASRKTYKLWVTNKHSNGKYSVSVYFLATHQWWYSASRF